MIKNERQYRITKAQADKFANALAQLETQDPHQRNLDPALAKAERDALEGQLDTLREELAEYEATKAGKLPARAVQSLDDLPRLLIQKRIAAGMTQKALAHKLGLKPQQIQRYEATDYASVSLSRLQEIAHALGLSRLSG